MAGGLAEPDRLSRQDGAGYQRAASGLHGEPQDLEDLRQGLGSRPGHAESSCQGDPGTRSLTDRAARQPGRWRRLYPGGKLPH